MKADTVMENAKKYVKWCKDKGRAPCRRSDDPEESRLSGWMSSYKPSYLGIPNCGRLPRPDVNEYMTANLGKQAFDSRATRCMSIAKKYIKSCIKNSRRPSRTGGQDGEVKMAMWFDSYRRGCKGTGDSLEYPEVTGLLKKYLGENVLPSERGRPLTIVRGVKTSG